MGPRGELFFFQRKSRVVLSELIEFRPCISAETVKACAWIGLHMMAEEIAFGRTATLLLIWETCRGMAAQKALCAAATALNGKEVRALLLLEYYEHIVGNLALEVVGQDWSSEVISLS